MATRFADNVQELATCTGTTGDILLAGVPPGSSFALASSKHADLDVVLYGMLQGTEPSVTEEYGIGIYRTGPSRIVRTGAGTLVFRSTNGNAPVNWGAGDINVILTGSGHLFESLMDPNGGTGILVNTAWRAFARRTLTGTAKLPVINGSGVAGNPTLDQSWLDAHVLDRDSAAAEADREMGGRLILGAVATVWKGLASQLHKWWGDDALTDQVGELFRNGANDWRLRMMIGGSPRRLLHATAADLNDADRLATLTLAQVRTLSGWPAGNRYASGAQSLTAAASTLLTLAHGLGAKPSLVLARLTCTSTDLSYAVNDTVELGAGIAGSGSLNFGHTVRTDATNLYVRFASNSNIYEIARNTGAADTIAIDASKWTIEFFAYA